MTNSSSPSTNGNLQQELRQALLQIDQAQTQLQQVRLTLARLEQRAHFTAPDVGVTAQVHRVPATAQPSAQQYPPVPTHGPGPTGPHQPVPVYGNQPVPPRPVPGQQPAGRPNAQQPVPVAAMRQQNIAPAEPWWTNEKLVVRLLGVFGGVVTFAGVAFLIGLGIERGLLGPAARMILAISLGVLLVGAAQWMQSKRFHTAAVGSAFYPGLFTLGICIWAAHDIMEWTNTLVSIGLYIALSIGAVLLGYLWRRVSLLIGASIAATVINQFVFNLDGNTTYFPHVLPALLLAITGVTLHERNTVLASGFLALVAQTLSLQLLPDDTMVYSLYGMIALLVLIAVCEFELDEPRLPMELSITGIVLLLLVTGDTMESSMVIIVLALWVWLSAQARLTPWLLLPFALATLTYTGDFDNTILKVGLSLAVVALVFWIFSTKPVRAGLWEAWILLIVVVTAYTVVPVVGAGPGPFNDVQAYAIVLGAVAVLAVMIIQRHHLLQFNKYLRWTLAGVGLYLMVVSITGLTTTTAALLNRDLVYLGLFIGHAIVSIGWILLAAWLMLRKHSSVGTGTTIAIIGTVKLVFLDMASLDGLPRVAAFLVSGIILIVVATRRGKVADATTPTPMPSTPTPQSVASAQQPTTPPVPEATQPRPVKGEPST